MNSESSQEWCCVSCGRVIPKKLRRQPIFACPECGEQLDRAFYLGTSISSDEIEKELRSLSFVPNEQDPFLLPASQTASLKLRNTLDLNKLLHWFVWDPEKCVMNRQAQRILRSLRHTKRPWIPSPNVFDRMSPLQRRQLLYRSIEFRTKEELKDYEKQRARWHRPWWDEVRSVILNLRPPDLPAAHLPPDLATRFADYMSAYLLTRTHFKPMREADKQFVRRLVKSMTRGRRRPVSRRAKRGRQADLRTRIIVAMSNELERNNYERTYASQIIATIFELVAEEKLLPSSISRIIRRSRPKRTQSAS